MKCRIQYFALFLAILLVLGGCTQESSAPTETEAPTLPSLPNISVEELYDTACEEISGSDNLVISYEYTHTRSIRGETYTRTIVGSDSYTNIGTDQMNGVVRQTLRYGSYQTNYVELYQDGMAYALVNGSNFAAEMTADSFLLRQLPGLLVDRTLYQNITIHPETDALVITFTQATAPESWAAIEEDAQLISATATARLSPEGKLLEYGYQLRYCLGEADYQLDVRTKVTTPQSLDLSAFHPDSLEDYTLITHLDGPKMLLQAAGDIFTSQSISAQITQVVASDVYSQTHTRESIYHITGQGDALQALCDTQLTLVDYRGDATVTNQLLWFQNGILSSKVDADAPIQDAQTAENIRIQWENHLLSGLFSLTYLSDIQLTDTGDFYELKLTGNDTYCTAIAGSLAALLPNDLDALASSYETTAAGGYLTVSKITGLPVAMGMTFQRNHIIDYVSYPLSYSQDQTFTLSSTEAASAILDAIASHSSGN